jgi:tetratricopeptide (TPR) repeat protein
VPEDGPSAERVRAALDEVLGWQGLSRSPQLADLLRYVVERTLAGDSGGIKAYSIAVDVLGRSAEFDPQNDPIVRVQARRLRSLLEQYYGAGLGRSDVEIRLPLGRYVPEFVPVTAASPLAPARSEDRPELQSRPLWLSPFVSNAMLAMIFTLVGVILAIALVRWMLPQMRGPLMPPGPPQVVVGSFDNLTGQPVLDDDVAQVGVRLATSLQRFENIVVGTEGYRLTGTVQQTDGRFVLRASLAQGDSAPWTTTINAPLGLDDTSALSWAGNILAARLGNATGPLHAPARAWLDMQEELQDQPSSYLCMLLYMNWRESRRLTDADRGAKCLGGVLSTAPDDAVTLAALADIESWRGKFLAGPTVNLSELMSAATTAAGRAVTLKPTSSFVHEQQAVVLARQGSIDAALGSVRKALQLNPANLDAVAIEGQLRWTDGDYAVGAQEVETALAALPAPPPWYFLTRALNALREDRFFDAIDAAQALAAGEDELAPIVALTAAPRAARTDLIDRYRPLVLGNSQFQAMGIMPRVQMRISAPGVLQRIRTGLVLAGLPVNALDAPFNPDGSMKVPGLN